MRHLGMLEAIKSEIRISKSETSSKSETRASKKKKPHLSPLPQGEAEIKSKVLTKFEWLYTKHAGTWYPKVAAGDAVKKGEPIGKVGDLFGDTLEKIISPVDGVVLFLTINPSVLENGLLMGIGTK
jgi:predicted deacylase